MKTLLIFPPSSDPTQPYHSLAYLSAFLRQRGCSVVVKDANIEAYDRLLTRSELQPRVGRVGERLGRLNRKRSLSFDEQKEYLAVCRAWGGAPYAAENVERAKARLRDPHSFYDPEAYDWSVRVIQAALRLISASHHPLELSFTRYSTPFHMLSCEEILADMREGTNPFLDYYESHLARAVNAERPGLVGISMVFPAQLAQGFIIAWLLRRGFPNLHVVGGGPALTQLAIRQNDAALRKLFDFFDSIVAYEGEQALWALIQRLQRGRDPVGLRNVIWLDRKRDTLHFNREPLLEDLDALPCPDYDGYPLKAYLSPSLVLPYSPSRGCYWQKCAFCCYGLTRKATSCYRERSVAKVVADLQNLSAKHGTRRFYFADDTLAPKTMVKLSRALLDAGLDVEWSTDVRPEKRFTAARCRVLKRAGCVSVAVGIESGSQRVLNLMEKGTRVPDVQRVIRDLSRAGIAVQVMTFTGFPTETAKEALKTVRLIRRILADVALFVVCDFDLVPGSKAYERPERYGLVEVYHLKGDEFGMNTYYVARKPGWSDSEATAVESAIADLASRFRLRSYPYAGTVSVCHSFLYFSRYGKDVFKDMPPPTAELKGGASAVRLRFDLSDVTATVADSSTELAEALREEHRAVSRELYRRITRRLPPVQASGRTCLLHC